MSKSHKVGGAGWSGGNNATESRSVGTPFKGTSLGTSTPSEDRLDPDLAYALSRIQAAGSIYQESLRSLEKEQDKALRRMKKDFDKRLQDERKSIDDSIKEEVGGAVKYFEESELEPLKEKLDQDRLKVIEVIGIFVSIFTFVSAEITIMRGVCAVYWSGFTLILLGGLSFFVLLMRFMAKEMSVSVLVRGEQMDVSWKVHAMNLWQKWFGLVALMSCAVVLITIGLAQTRSAMYNEPSVCGSNSGNYSIMLNGGDTNVRVTR